MKIKIDFQLSSQFNCLERVIFRFVLNGFADVKQIVGIIPVFSDTVIANGIKHLVNQQILVVKKERTELAVAAPLLAIMAKCHEKTFELQIPDELASFFAGDNGMVLNNYERNNYALKKTIISELLPDVSLSMYINTIDFILYSVKGMNNE